MRRDIHLHLSGYLGGHVMVTLAHWQAAMRRPFWDPKWDEAFMTYSAFIASPEAQRVLTIPSLHAVNKAHQFACLVAAARTGKQAPDPQQEVMLYRWLASRAGIELPSDVEAHVGRLRLRRERLRPDSALGLAMP